MDSTARLGMNKPNPDPVTGDPVDITKLNENFDKIDAAINATLCTSTTRPSSPFQGQVIQETDTGRIYARIGSSWVQFLISAGATGAFLSHIESQRPSTFDHVLRHKLAGDTEYRLIIRADGQIQIGQGGTTPPDVNLYRASANNLKTDNALIVQGALNAHLVAVKTGNETLPPSTTTMQDDDHLFIGGLAANATYILDGDIIYYAAVGADLQAGWSAPAGSTMEWSSWAPSASHTGSPAYEGVLKFESRNISQTQAWGGTGAIIHAMPRGCLQTSGTTGTLRFRWAQQAAVADSNIVYAKSWIRLQRVA